MKLLFSFFILILSTSFGYSQTVPKTNHFNAAPDTLVLKSTRIKGAGLFQMIGCSAVCCDTAECRKQNRRFDFQLIYPANLSDIKLGFSYVYLNLLRYFSVDGRDVVMEKMKNSENLIGLISGTRNNEKVFVLDQNRNCDFRDDTVRDVKKFNWGRSNNLLVCKYTIHKGGDTLTDSSWIEVGSFDDMLLEGTFQQQVCSFSIGNQSYKIGLADGNPNSFCFDRPMLALLAENEVVRDSLFKRDFLFKGQYLKLGRNYYKFHDFYNGCGTIILVKENDYANQVGIQVGLIAPSLRFRTIDGDTLTSAGFKNKRIVVANVSGCGPRSYDRYKDLVNAAGDDLIIIGIDSGVKKGLGGKMVDATDPYNKGIYLNFRNAYSSYDCYLISEEGRVIDKFDVTQWESILSQYLKKK